MRGGQKIKLKFPQTPSKYLFLIDFCSRIFFSWLKLINVNFKSSRLELFVYEILILISSFAIFIFCLSTTNGIRLTEPEEML